MGTYYTTDDVSRWEKSSQETISFQLEALRMPGITPDIRWQRYGTLSGAYHSLAMVAIARKQFADARDCLRTSIEMGIEQYAIRIAQDKETSAGDFQSVLLAYASADQPVIAKMVAYYQWENGITASVYFGKIIKSLALGDIAIAQSTLSEKRPRFEKMFEAYPDCFHAMTDKNEVAFQAALSVASKNWARRAARFEKGLPHAVCFLQGAGIVRLAEQVMDTKLSINDDNIPVELLA